MENELQDDWVFEDRRASFRVVIGQETVASLLRWCSLDHSKETGGILVGSYSDPPSTATIAEVTGPPPDSFSERICFHRGTVGLQELLRHYWDAEPRSY